jgi:hypothetical protein
LSAALGAPSRSYAESTSWTYEVGVKSRLLDGRGHVDVATFYNDVVDEQLFVLDFVSFQFVPVNLDTRSFGVEVQGDLALGDGWRLDGGASWTNGKISEASAASGAVPGNRIPNVARFGSTLTLSFDGEPRGLGGFNVTPLLTLTHQYVGARLMARVCADPDLQRRVSILPMGIFEAPLPVTISGAVISAVLVHFDSRERTRLWQLLSSRLMERGRVVTDIPCPEAVDLPQTRMSSSRVGRIAYEGYAQATALPSSRQRWRMTYRALLDEIEIERNVAEFVCHAASADEVAREAKQAGFETQGQADLVIMNKRARGT